MTNKIQVYLAGPCFTAAERRWNVQVKGALDASQDDYVFYLPQNHVKESWSRAMIYSELRNGVVQADALVANLDGPGGDDGTCWEMGFMAGMEQMRDIIEARPILWYRTDFRRGGDSEQNVNLMMAFSAVQIDLSDTEPLSEHDSYTPSFVAHAILEALDDHFFPVRTANVS